MAKYSENSKESPQNSRIGLALSIVFLGAAVLLRFLFLGNKPIHFDESINMWFVRRIIEDGFFTYDPTNFHGPLFFYLVHFMQLFTGFDFIATRWVASIFSFLTLALLWFGPRETRPALRWSALFLLLSPAMGFYGRSGIHESTFVFFQVLGFLSFHYLIEKDFKKFWWAFAAGLLGMMALKETFVVLILAWIPAFAMILVLKRKSLDLAGWGKDLQASFRQESVYMTLLMMLLFFIGIYAGFGAHPKGLADFFVALMPWLKTGVHGSGHEKEFLYWTKMMVQNDFTIVAGFFVGLFFVRKNKWISFYAVFTVVLWLIYSLIPYKTPWCVISFLWPFAIVAGFGADEVWKKQNQKLKAAFVAALAVGFVLQAPILYKTQFRDPIAMDHVYVYVNSTYQMKEFIQKVQEVSEKNPLLREKVIQIGASESWPFPIVFFKYYNLNYQKYSLDVVPGALLYIVDSSDQEVFEAKLQDKENYQVFDLETRQGRAKTPVYVRKEFFQNAFSWPVKDVVEQP